MYMYTVYTTGGNSLMRTPIGMCTVLCVVSGHFMSSIFKLSQCAFYNILLCTMSYLKTVLF